MCKNKKVQNYMIEVSSMFISYTTNLKGYKLYNSSNSKIMASRDVKFNKEAAWNWEKLEQGIYDFFLYFEEESQVTMVHIKDITLPSSAILVASLTS